LEGVVLPAPRKARGRAVDRRNGAPDLSAVKAQEPLFEAPQGLRADTVAIWSGYWEDRASGLLRPSDRGVVLRWIKNVDRYLTLLDEADQEPIVSGSTGQPKPNGLYEIAYRIEDKIRADEAQLGIGPKNGLSLGLLAIQERRTLADLNRQYGGGDGNRRTAPKPGPDDPRVTVISTG
jgi:hypothetical protein